MTRYHLIIAGLLAVFLISGCTPNNTRPDTQDSTGDLGEDTESPNKGASDIYVQLAVAYLGQGQMDVALKQAKKAVDIDSTSVDARNVLALVYDRLGESSQAETHFKAGIQAHPKDPYIRNAYGTMLCRQNRFKEADVQFQAALKNPLYKTPEVALTNAGICDLARNDPVQAEVNLRSALQRNPRYATALMEMAKLSYENGEYLSSRAYLQRYLAVAGPTPSSLWLGIRTESQLGDRDAVASYSMMLRNQYPDSQEIQLLRDWDAR